MARLRFKPAGAETFLDLPVGPASSLLVEIMKAGAYIRHDCGGKALCGTCRIEVGPASSLSPPRPAEVERLAALGLAPEGGVRLACQTHAFRDAQGVGCLGPERTES